MNEKAIYTQKAPQRGNAGGRVVMFFGIIVLVMVLLFVVNGLPYSGILTLAVFAVAAFLVHKLLNRTVFDITYALYDDKLVFLRKYGKIEMECEVFSFEEAKFYSDKIEHRGKVYSFSPDAKLKQLLNI
ncbi:MAG: hypothetical protein IJ316_04230 [Clostridia bacterium]|nr:hypothetical protein [Clostridia bacterium]